MATQRRTLLAGALCTAALGLALSGAAQQAPAQKAPAPMAHTHLKVGDEAPDFTLLDQDRNQVHLKDFRGKKNVVLAFYIFAFTGG